MIRLGLIFLLWLGFLCPSLAQPAQPPVVVNITNAAANAPEPQADDGTDPSENYDSEGNVIWTPPLQQMLDTVKSGANKNQPATGAITTVSQMPMG